MTPAEHSIHAWLRENDFRTEKGQPLSFYSHLALFEPYCDFSPDQAYKKCSQWGVTIMKMIKAIYGAKFRGWNMIYTLPSDKDVFEAVPSKFDMLVKNNAAAIGEVAIDKVEMKNIGDRFVFFKGTISKTGSIMTQADGRIHDEIDRSDMKIVDEYSSRTTQSTFRGNWQISNPSTPGFGIDKAFRNSDQKEWIVICRKCKVPQILTWEKNVDMKRGIFICASCGKELMTEERRVGRWEAQNPGHARSGYHFTQMMAPWIDAKYLVKEREEKGDEYFMPFILGEPYSAANAAIDRQMLLDCWTNRDLTDGETEYFMGVDNGVFKHWVLGTRRGITRVGRTDDWADIDLIIRRYKPKIVYDALPDITEVRRRVATEQRSYMCYYNDAKAKKEGITWGEKKEFGVVWASRSRSIGGMVEEFLDGDILISLDPKDPEFLRFVEHLETVRRLPEETPLHQIRYVWTTISTEDHYAHAANYYLMARGPLMKERGGLVSGAGEKAKAIIMTPTGAKMNLQEYMRKQGFRDNRDENA